MADSGFAGTPLAVPWRHRATESDEDARYWRSERTCPYSSFFASDTVGRESDAASQREFIEMDSRNLSETAFLCVAGGIRRV